MVGPLVVGRLALSDRAGLPVGAAPPCGLGPRPGRAHPVDAVGSVLGRRGGSAPLQTRDTVGGSIVLRRRISHASLCGILPPAPLATRPHERRRALAGHRGARRGAPESALRAAAHLCAAGTGCAGGDARSPGGADAASQRGAEAARGPVDAPERSPAAAGGGPAREYVQASGRSADRPGAPPVPPQGSWQPGNGLFPDTHLVSPRTEYTTRAALAPPWPWTTAQR